MTTKRAILTLGLASTMLLTAACGGRGGDDGDGSMDRGELKESVVEGQKTLAVAQSFLEAAGSGDMDTLSALMAEDFVWHNEGDDRLPWIGNWEGKETVLNDFLPKFGAGLKTTSWTTDYSMAMGDQAIFMGTMSAIANNTGQDTGKFTWAVRVEVKDGKVMSWNWLEDSYAVSKAYNAEEG